MVTERQLFESRIIPDVRAGRHIKRCVKQSKQASKSPKSHEEYVKYYRDYYSKNLERRREQQRKCYYAHAYERKKYRWTHDSTKGGKYKLTEAQKKKRNEYNKKYRQEHKEEIREYQRKRYQKMKEDPEACQRLKEYQKNYAREYYLSHKFEICEKTDEYHKKHAEEYKAYRKRYYQEHKDEIAAKHRKAHNLEKLDAG